MSDLHAIRAGRRKQALQDMASNRSLRSIVYLAAPYSHKDKSIMRQRVIQINQAAATLSLNGIVPYSPISHWCEIATQCRLPHSWDFWEKLDKVFLDVCSSMAVLMLDGWDDSVGVKAELEYFQAHHPERPIMFLSFNEHIL